IMLKWLEFGDWGEAFDQVIPKRKGGTLKSTLARDEHRSEDGQGASIHSDDAENGDEADDGEDCSVASNKAIEKTAEVVQGPEEAKEVIADSQ
ncbi:hypothetical protein LTS18_014704, partial [Coniosporium uncinatum]